MQRITVNPGKINDYYFPVNIKQVRNLVGKMLTHVEAMGLSEKAEQANKDLIEQAVYSWWGDAQDNSLTSWQGSIGPIVSPSLVSTSDADDSKWVWITDVGEIKSVEEGSYDPNVDGYYTTKQEAVDSEN